MDKRLARLLTVFAMVMRATRSEKEYSIYGSVNERGAGLVIYCQDGNEDQIVAGHDKIDGTWYCYKK